MLMTTRASSGKRLAYSEHKRLNAVILPKEALASLGVELGDRITFTDAPGGVNITKYDPEFSEKMAVAREVMKRRLNALRELAK